MQASPYRFSGRLRLRLPRLKRQPLRAAKVAAAIRALNGVLSVDANAVSGSLLVIYDVSTADRTGLWSALEDVVGAFDLHEPELQKQAWAHADSPPRSPSTGKLADALVGAVVEKLVGRSTLALVAALL